MFFVIFEALHLVQPGLTAGKQAGWLGRPAIRPSIRQTAGKLVNFKKSLYSVGSIIGLFAFLKTGIMLFNSTNAFKAGFLEKYFFKGCCMSAHFLWKPYETWSIPTIQYYRTVLKKVSKLE